MAAAQQAQDVRLVPVLNEPGAVQFTYHRAGVALGAGLALGSGSALGGSGSTGPPANGLLGVVEDREQAVEPAAGPPGLNEQPDDFIALDFSEDATEKAQQGAQQPAAAGPFDGLIGDYISLGIIEDPAKAAQGAQAKAAAGSSRPEELRRVPWLSCLKGIRSPLLRLHEEVVQLCRYLAPSPEEQQLRQGALNRIEDVVTSIWPKAKLQVFGSFATGLYLPTSDVDAVIMDSGCPDIPQGLKALANSLARKNMAKNMQVIAKARVPIVKFEDAETGYNFDVSFDVANGPEAAENVRGLMDSLPPMRPLVMVLKVFLQQRELNEVYSGGLGSYALLVMVAAFLQLHPSRQPPASAHRYGSSKGQAAAGELEGSLGVLLVDFFRLYGRALNNVEVGVSCRRGGAYFSKRSKGFFQAERPFLFAVEDPNDPENDLGRNSYNISRVRMAFDWAYCQLTAPSEPGTSLLQRIIRLDPVLFLRAPPAPLPDDAPSPPGLTKKKSKKRGREAQDDEQQQQQQQQQQQREGRREGRREKRRRHRERSLSDEDRAPGAGSRWQLEEAEQEEEEQQQQQQQQREGHGRKDKHKHHHHNSHNSRSHSPRHHHHHHHRHHHNSGSGDGRDQRRNHHHRERQQQQQQRQQQRRSGGSSRHIYFD